VVFDLHIGMISKLNMAIVGDSNDWLYDSDVSVHICNNKAYFKE